MSLSLDLFVLRFDAKFSRSLQSFQMLPLFSVELEVGCERISGGPPIRVREFRKLWVKERASL